jgi:hypothetical protein
MTPRQEFDAGQAVVRRAVSVVEEPGAGREVGMFPALIAVSRPIDFNHQSEGGHLGMLAPF